MAVIISVTPSAGPAGTPITITGTGFVSGLAVLFDTGSRSRQDCTPQVVSPTEIRTVVPDLLDGLAGTIEIAVIAPDGSESDRLEFAVTAAPAVAGGDALCSLAEAKQLLGVAQDETDSDERIRTLISVASAQITGYCGRAFGLSDVVDELHDGDGTDVLQLDVTPVVSLASLSIDGQSVDVGELAVYPTLIGFRGNSDWNPRLRAYARVFPIGRQNVRVSYRAGYAAVPRDISDACKFQVAFLMNTLNKQGIISETNQVAQATTTYTQAQLAPPARVICNRYRRPRVAVV